MRLTGKQRLMLTRLWFSKYRDQAKEDFIKKVCKAKGILYTPPPKLDKKFE